MSVIFAKSLQSGALSARNSQPGALDSKSLGSRAGLLFSLYDSVLTYVPSVR